MSGLPRTIDIGGKPLELGITMADRLVNWFSSEAGQRRLYHRTRAAMLGQNAYTAADKSRRANHTGGPREQDADSAILPYLVTLREESQHLERNNPIGTGALKTNVTKVVGTGLRPKAQVNRRLLGLSDAQANAWERAAEDEFALAAETVEIDAEREQPLSLLGATAFLRVLADGDLVVNLPRFARRGSPYTTKIQLIEAARICNPQFTADTDTLVAGVRKDPSTGAPKKYYVCSRHPGNRRPMVLRNQRRQYAWQVLRAFADDGTPLALHLKDKTRPGQTRGVPYLTPVIELIKQLGRYTDAEVMAAVVSGMLTVFVHNDTGNPAFRPAPTPGNPDGDQALQAEQTGMELGYGSVIGIRNGTKVETVNPARPNTAFDPFFIAIARQIGMALELPFELLVKHFTSSYSASKAAFEDAWDYFLRRRHWLACQFYQPIYEAIITEAIFMGRLAAPGFFSDPLIRAAWLGSTWLGDAPNQIDELKAANAAEKRMAIGLTTLAEERSRLVGGDHEHVRPQIEADRQWLDHNNFLPPEPTGGQQQETE